MNMAKVDNDDPDRVRPPLRGKDESKIGQEKNTQGHNKIFAFLIKNGNIASL